MDLAGRCWIKIHLYGVLGVECSNHSVPTIFFNDLAQSSPVGLFHVRKNTPTFTPTDILDLVGFGVWRSVVRHRIDPAYFSELSVAPRHRCRRLSLVWIIGDQQLLCIDPGNLAFSSV